MSSGDFIMVTYSPAGYKEGLTENNLLLKEIFHQNRAYVNADSGRALGLKTWDTALLSTPNGKVEVTVMLTPGMEPRTIALARGGGHEGYGNIEKRLNFDNLYAFTK